MATAPAAVKFSPDGQWLTYLQAEEKAAPQQLHALHLSTGDTQVVAPPGGGVTEATLSLEEQLRRERQRQLAVGITDYQWSPNADKPCILVPQNGDLYAQNGMGSTLELVFSKSSTGCKGGAIAPQVSPDGQSVAFVQDGEVFVQSLAGGDAVQVTSGAREAGKTNGLADFIAQEEMDRYDGFWWSPDSTRIAFEEVDESHIPVYRIMHQGKDALGASAEEDHRYPFVGKANPKVRLGVVTVATKAVTWMDIAGHEYLARVNWTPDGRLLAQVENREQTLLQVLCFDDAGVAREVLREDVPDGNGWVNIHDVMHFVSAPEGAADAATPHFIWASERTGFRHLYLYRLPAGGPAEEVRQITGGQFVVKKICSVDAARNYVYFMCNVGTPTFMLCCRAPVWPAAAGRVSGLVGPEAALSFRPRDFSNFTMDSSVSTVSDWAWAGDLYGDDLKAFNIERVTQTPGYHSVTLDASCSYLVDSFSNTTTRPTMVLFRVPNDGDEPRCLHLTDEPSVFRVLHQAKAAPAPLGSEAGAGAASAAAPASASGSDAYDPDAPLAQPELVALATADSKEVLMGAVYKPDAAVHGTGPFPTVMAVYGGPGVARVRDWWHLTEDPRTKSLVSKGFVVFKLDNRGGFDRGTRFERALRHDMGNVEVADQVHGVAYLTARGLCDNKRVGINGWSYGGYLSALSLAREPDVFHVAVSGAPVTDWDGYDTHYTERYMGTPETNPDGYKSSSVMTHAGRIKGKLMLVHGLIDENVHFRHTARLINALIAHRIPYDLLLFPEERHTPRRPADRAYMEHRIAAYFIEHLGRASSL